jgi:hypothetical protein
MGQLLTTSSSMTCPHGGQVQAVSSNTRAKAGATILRSSDTFTIAGCAFVIALAPHPCVTVQWVKSNVRTKVAGDYMLAADSVGLCLAGDQAPQGTVVVSNTQAKVSGI